MINNIHAVPRLLYTNPNPNPNSNPDPDPDPDPNPNPNPDPDPDPNQVPRLLYMRPFKPYFHAGRVEGPDV